MESAEDESEHTSAEKVKVPQSQDQSVFVGSTADIEKKVTEVFQVFDLDQSNSVNVREVGTILRYLGMCPTELELLEIVNEVEDEDVSDQVTLERFVPVATQIIAESRFPLCPEDTLLEAFQALDIDKKGHLSQEELITYLTTEGEPFSQDELDEALAMMVNKDTGKVDYFDVVSEMSSDSRKNGHSK